MIKGDKISLIDFGCGVWIDKYYKDIDKYDCFTEKYLSYE